MIRVFPAAGRLGARGRAFGADRSRRTGPDVAAEVTHILQDHFHNTHGERVKLSLSGPVAQQPWSMIFTGTCSIYPFPLVAKVCLAPSTGTVSEIAAEKQFRGLERAAARMGEQTPFAVPRPLALVRARGIVLMERVEGRPLRHMLVRLTCTASEARERAYVAGEWLRWLHRTHSMPPRPPDMSPLLAALGSAGEGSTSCHSGGIANRAAAALRRTAASFADVCVPWSCAHGDYKPGNLLISDRRVVGIDIDFQDDATAADIGHFLNHLQLLAHDPRAINLLPGIGVLSERFLAGYGGDESPGFRRLLRWMQLYKLLYLRQNLDRWNDPGPRRVYQRLCIERLMRALLPAVQ